MAMNKSLLFGTVLCFFLLAKGINGNAPTTTVKPKVQCLVGNVTDDQLNSVTNRRTLIGDIWSRLVGAYGEEVQSTATLFQEIYDTTDSHSLKALIYRASVLVYYYIASPDIQIQLCYINSLVNATLKYDQTKENCDEAIAAYTTIINSSFSLCRYIAVATLKNVNCDFDENIPVFPVKCYRSGAAFDLAGALNQYGKLWPCSLQKQLQVLYGSANRGIRLIPLLVIYAVNDLISETFDAIPAASLNELSSTGLLKPAKYCCHPRFERLTVVCTQISTSVQSNLQTIIHNKFYSD